MEVSITLIKIASIILVIGGLSLGLVGLSGFDPIARVFGVGSLPARIFYVLVGACALFMLLVMVGVVTPHMPKEQREGPGLSIHLGAN